MYPPPSLACVYGIVSKGADQPTGTAFILSYSMDGNRTPNAYSRIRC